MPMIQADDGVRLYAESTGSGKPNGKPLVSKCSYA